MLGNRENGVLMPTTTEPTKNGAGAPPILIQDQVDKLRSDEHDLGKRTDRLTRDSGLTVILSMVALLVGIAALTVALINGTSGSNSSAPAAAQAPGASAGGAAKPATPPSTAGAAAAAGKVDVKLGEMFVRPNTQVVRAGKVTFTVSNTGTLTHEMIVEKTPVSIDPSGKANEGHAAGEVPETLPGKSGKVTLSLKAGTYQLFCNVPGHYAAGQRTNLTVTKG
jgi:uncharacterized cupredoxin-like copper-binding protein